jgi:predicted CXXCH cytochrome family protein
MMKRCVLVLVALSVTAISSAALAETPKNGGREVIKLKMGELELPFQHWKHQNKLNNECFQCHATKIGKIDGWGKETAHTLCISCHELEEKGPVSCQQCHTK